MNAAPPGGTVRAVEPGQAALDALWKASTYDPGCVSVALTHIGRGIGFPAMLGHALLQAGRVQPTIISTTRAPRRSDIGRLQVALAAERLDVVVQGADRAHPADLDLLHAATSRAGVDLWLIAHGPFPDPLRNWIGERAATLSDTDAEKAFAGRPTAGGRSTPWPCQAALALDASTDPAPRCTQHHDAVACALAWMGHAVATATIDEHELRLRLHQLTITAPTERAWAIYARGRFTTTFAERAAGKLGLNGAEQRQLSIGDCAADGSRLTVQAGRVVDVPEHMRPILATQRAVRLAEGFPLHAQLLRVQDCSIPTYLRVTGPSAVDQAQA